MNLLIVKSFFSRITLLTLLAAILLALVNVSSAFAVSEIKLYEAESAALSGGAKVSQQMILGTQWCRYYSCSYYYDHPSSGGAYVSGLTAAGAKVKFTVEASNAGEFKLPLAYTTPNQQASTLAITVLDQALNIVTPQRKINFPSVYDVPNTVEKTPFVELYEYVTLAQGTNYITLERKADDVGEIYLDYIQTMPLVIDTNVVKNSGFESGSIEGWKESHPAGQLPAYGIDGNDVNSGNHKLYFWSETSYEQSMSQSMVIDNGTYEISAWVKLQSYSGELPAIAQMETNNYGVLENVSIPVSSEWTQIRKTVNIEHRDFTIGFHLKASGSTSLQVDDISIKPLLINGNFESGHIQGWTEWHPEGQKAKFGVDKGDLNNNTIRPYNGYYKLYFYNDTPYQQSVHQKITGLENGTYKVKAYVKLISYDWQKSPSNPYVTQARMEVADHGSEQLNVTIPEAQKDISNYYAYQEITTTFNVTTGQMDLGFYLNALENNTSLQIDYVQLYKIQ